METRFHGLCVCFSGNFGVRSIVLCKCSGKYIDIYFSLKITFLFFYNISDKTGSCISYEQVSILSKYRHCIKNSLILQDTEDSINSTVLSAVTDKYVLDTLAVIRTLVDK